MDYNRFQKTRTILRQKQLDLTVITKNVHLSYNLFAIMRTCEAVAMMGMTQSLNVSVAVAVILFEAHQQRLKEEFYDQLRISLEAYEKMIFEWAYPEVANSYQAHHKPYPLLDNNGEITISL